jgi:membrane protein DedA with SNARE-associated domain
MEHLLTTHGYLAIVLFALIESTFLPIPSEVTFGYAGVLAYEGHLNIVLALILGVIAETVGSTIAFLIGRAGGRPLVARYGKYVLLTTGDLDRAERWLDGKGEFAIAVGRALPILRLFVSYVAGIADMALGKFVMLSLLGTAVYASVLGGIGYGVGSAWTKIYHDFSFAGYIIIVLVVLAIAAVVRHRLVELRRAKGAHSSTR